MGPDGAGCRAASAGAEAFHRWIRGGFRQLNTGLEGVCFARKQRHAVQGVGDDLKPELVEQGRTRIADILNERGVCQDDEQSYNLLG